MRVFLVVVGVLLVCCAVVAVIAVSHRDTIESSARGTGGRAVVIDPEAGRVGSAQLGDPPATLDPVLGARRRSGRSEISKEWIHLGVPGTYGYPSGCGRANGKPVAVIQYPGAEVSACAGRSFLVVITSRGSKTTASAAIGDPLDSAAGRHPSLKCHTSTGDTTDPPVPVYRYCTGPVSDGRYLWLGQDPVSSIALATVPLQ